MSPRASGVEGLGESQAAERLRDEGPNELPGSARRATLRNAADVLREPMLALLLACGGVYLLLGEPAEALPLLGFVVLVALLTVYEEQRTERALEALRELSSPRALVVREGRRRRIAGREVVRGDLVTLSEGDRVPADARLREAEGLELDESLLTGESLPVRKRSGACVLAGTLVTRGQGLAEVCATGPRTQMGRIGRTLTAAGPERSALQRETRRLVRILAVGASGLCVLVVVAYGVQRGDWLTAFLAGLTLAMAILPNELPAVLAIFLALGAWRAARRRVLTRRVPALEALGAATVLCVDKTGTLTQNRMIVRELRQNGEAWVTDDGAALPEAFHELAEYGILASQRDPFDPMEQAFHALGARRLAGTEHLHPSWTPVKEYPLSEGLLALSLVWQSPDGVDLVIAAKGAPEAIADLCHLPEARLRVLEAEVAAMARRGLRVLGVARALFRSSPLPPGQHDFDFELVGLAGLVDPVRPGVPEAIAQCREAGIRVLMLTGDHPQTARAVAAQVGLGVDGGVLTGAELEGLDDASLAGRLRAVNVFARVAPEQKLRLVRALRSAGEVVAMTGDGINDAPALRAADIGVAMGGRGTDVAREASALVLLDDDFTSLVAAIRLGRRVFDNLGSAMAYILAAHVPIAGLALAPALLGLPLVLLPLHVALLHLIIEPACSVVFDQEPADPELMRRPPRDPRARLFGRRVVGPALLQGGSVLAVLSAVFVVTLARGKGEAEARALAFTTLIVANLALILANRSLTGTIASTLRRPNPALWWVLGGAVVMLALVLGLPALRERLRMGVLHADDLLLCAAAGLVSVAWLELVKRRRARAHAPAGAGPHIGGWTPCDIRRPGTTGEPGSPVDARGQRARDP
jgi:Ca2+-transporting ATPase